MTSEEVEKTTRDLRERWQRYYDSVQRPQKCIFCPGKRIHFNGSRSRSASVWIVQQVVHISELCCRRVKCKSCKQSWTLRPPGVIAHKHFQLCVVAQALSRYLFDPCGTLTAVGSQYQCSRKTVKRWALWTARVSDPKHLLHEILSAVDAPILPRLRQVTQLCRKARDTVMQQVLKAAAEVLGLMECLCSAWELEPPGLSAVVQTVLGDRRGMGTHAHPVIPELVRGTG